MYSSTLIVATLDGGGTSGQQSHHSDLEPIITNQPF